MKLLLIFLLWAMPAIAAADCLPKEAGGTGTSLQVHFVDQGTVIGWRCAGVFTWVGSSQRDMIPFQQEDLLIRQLRTLKAEPSLRRAANVLELRSK